MKRILLALTILATSIFIFICASNSYQIVDAQATCANVGNPCGAGCAYGCACRNGVCSYPINPPAWNPATPLPTSPWTPPRPTATLAPNQPTYTPAPNQPTTAPPYDPCYVNCNRQVCDLNITTNQIVCTNPGLACCGYCVPDNPNWGCGDLPHTGVGTVYAAIYDVTRRGYLYDQGRRSCGESSNIMISRSNYDYCNIPLDEVYVYIAKSRRPIGESCRTENPPDEGNNPRGIPTPVPVAREEDDEGEIQVYLGENYVPADNIIRFAHYNYFDDIRVKSKSCYNESGVFTKNVTYLYAHYKDVKGCNNLPPGTACNTDQDDRAHIYFNVRYQPRFNACGQVIASDTGEPVAGVPILVYNDSWNQQTRYAVTDENGYWGIPRFLGIGDFYKVTLDNRPGQSIPIPFLSPLQTNTFGWTWDYGLNSNTPLGRPSYENQKFQYSDCSWTNDNNEYCRCNFIVDRIPPVIARLEIHPGSGSQVKTNFQGSGLKSNDDSVNPPAAGSDINNPINITTNIETDEWYSPYISLVGFALTPNDNGCTELNSPNPPLATPTPPGIFGTVKSVDAVTRGNQKAIVALYALHDVRGVSDTFGRNFWQGRFYTYHDGVWSAYINTSSGWVTPTPSQPPAQPPSRPPFLITLTSSNVSGGVITANFQLTFLSSLGSQKWQTRAYGLSFDGDSNTVRQETISSCQTLN